MRAPIAGARISRYVPGRIPALSSTICEEMDYSVKRWARRIPCLVAFVAAAAGLTGIALAGSPAPDPAPGVQLTPRPDAAGGAPTPRIGTQSTKGSYTSSTHSQTSTTRTNTSRRTQTDAKVVPARTGVKVAKPIVPTKPLPTIAPSTKLVASAKHSGRDDTLLLGAALALGTLTLASLGLLGLVRRLRQEVAVR